MNDKTVRYTYDIYIDDQWMESIESGWSTMRLLRQVLKDYPNARRTEVCVRGYRGWSSIHYTRSNIPATFRVCG